MRAASAAANGVALSIRAAKRPDGLRVHGDGVRACAFSV